MTTNRPKLDCCFALGLTDRARTIKERGAPTMNDITPCSHLFCRHRVQKAFTQDQQKHYRERAMIGMRIGNRRHQQIRRLPMSYDSSKVLKRRLTVAH